ncbi:MAG: ATP synthase F1 subunit gamma [Thermoanaerobaculia bacterium]
MANLIDIRRRIKSVKNTQQITKAMKMVAAAKLRRSQDRVIAARPYAATLEATLTSVASRVPPREDGSPLHSLLATRPEKNVILLVVTGDKGLAGGFNTNVNRAVGLFLREAPARGIEKIQLVTIGRKGNDFWKRRPYEIIESHTGFFSKFGYADAAAIAKAMAARFVSGEVDAVYAVYNEFRSVMSQIVRTKRLLPIDLAGVDEAAKGAPANAATATGAAADGGANTVDYLYEPGPEVILDKLLPRHLEFQLYRLLLESNAAENGARMTAMDSASKNAGDLIDSLTLTYNRARQARITKELIEIVSGASALE